MAKDFDTEKPVYAADKLYSYTWPGCDAKVVSGKELTDLVKGADPSQLNIREVEAAVTIDTPGGHTIDVVDIDPSLGNAAAEAMPVKDGRRVPR